jgi:hypothetical protein
MSPLDLFKLCLGFCIALFFSSSLLRALPDDSHAGLLLETATYDWCHGDCGPFTTESALVCVQVEGKTLVGERNLDHDWREYYSQLDATQGKPIRIRYDNRSVWLMLVGAKEVHFNQRYDLDQMKTPACTAEIHRHMLQSLGDVKRPTSVPADAVLIPEGGRFFWHYYSWVRCSVDEAEQDNICTYWDKTGRKDYESHEVSEKDHRSVNQDELQVDAYTTRRNEVRLKNGTALVSDGRARVNGKLVTQQPQS